MRIGIDASRAFLRKPTGIEEYSHETIRHLRNGLRDVSVVLYVRKKIAFQNGRFRLLMPEIDFDLPEHWRVRGIWAPRFWTQIGLSLEMLLHPPEVLFVPAHTVPLIHPKRTIVTVHGLEYEFSPESYGFLERLYMRWSIRYSVRTAERVIAVSENTKRDLVRLYGVPEEKVRVIYEGFTQTQSPHQSRSETGKPYFFFVGRLETRKNVIRMVEAFELFKEKTGLSHELLLAGKPGYGYSEIRKRIAKSKYREAIREAGYVDNAEKGRLFHGAEAFLFPSLYEGFGLPVIEAQRAGIPVITSNTSSLPEIAGEGAILIDPARPEMIADAMETLVRNPEKRADIMRKALHNSQRFSWEKCAEGLVDVIFPVS